VRPAAFLDRDGTLIGDSGFVADAATVRLLPGVEHALGEWHRAGYALIVVTNQSGIARGLITWPQYHAVAARIDALLGAAGLWLDATYVCPHWPEVTGPCDCRKPGLALYRQAAAERGLDLSRSVWVGDRVRDVAPSRAFGGQGFLIGASTEDDEGFPRVGDLPAAAALSIAGARSTPPPAGR